MTTIRFDDCGGRSAVERKHGVRAVHELDWFGPATWAAMESMGSIFHIDQLIVIDPAITRARAQLVITYVNAADMPQYIALQRFGKQWRWRIMTDGQKAAFTAKAMMHARKSQVRRRGGDPVEFLIEDIDSPQIAPGAQSVELDFD